MNTTFIPIILALLLCAEPDPLVVNTVADVLQPGRDQVTLREALRDARSGDVITFDEKLDGATIDLSIIGEEHSILKGEVMGMRIEPSGPVSYLIGYFDRDYGASALYARKNITLDASSLPNGITLRWAGGIGNPARVLGIYGDLVLRNITITGGVSKTVDISATNDSQPWTLARGAGVAVWGKATLDNVVLFDNHCSGDFESSRDRGAFGGGLYANLLEVTDSIVSGNSVVGAGAAGGGIYSIGGAIDNRMESTIRRSTVSGNSIRAIFTYGGGVYSDGGGIGNSKTLKLINSTIAKNLVGPVALPPDLQGLYGMGYWRGGGVYMSNGSLDISNCTIVENEVHGYHRTDDRAKSNLAGGIAATIGNAHAVEDMVIGQSIIAGNDIVELDGFGIPENRYNQDIFTGSLVHFRSRGYNLTGVIDFSQMLVPVGEYGWKSLSRKHYPRQGDVNGVAHGDVIDLVSGVVLSDFIVSQGVDASEKTVLHYAPQGTAIDTIPSSYDVSDYFSDYYVGFGGTDDVIPVLLLKIQEHYGISAFASTVTSGFESYLGTVDIDENTDGLQPYLNPAGIPIISLADVLWFGPSQTWPTELVNYAYIDFYHYLDQVLQTAPPSGMGAELLGDNAWKILLGAGKLEGNDKITVFGYETITTVSRERQDQLGVLRPQGTAGDSGAIER